MKKLEKSFDGYSLLSLIIWCKYGSCLLYTSDAADE